MLPRAIYMCTAIDKEDLTKEAANANLKKQRFWSYAGEGKFDKPPIDGGIFIGIGTSGKKDTYGPEDMDTDLNVEMAAVWGCCSAQDIGKGKEMMAKLRAKMWVGLTTEKHYDIIARVSLLYVEKSDGRKSVPELLNMLPREFKNDRLIKEDLHFWGDRAFILDTTD